MKMIFIENHDVNYDYGESKVISLDPGASFYLEEKGISYSIPEDYYDHSDLIAGEKEYFIEQLKVLDSFDRFLKDNIEYCSLNDIPLFRANYLRFKYFIDTVVINSYVLSTVFEKTDKILEVVYMHKPFSEEGEPSIFEFKDRNRKVFNEILALYCKKRGIKFTDHIVEDLTLKKRKSSLSKSLLESLTGNRHLRFRAKEMANIIKHSKVSKLFPSGLSFEGLNVLFMHAGHFSIDHPIRELLGKKAGIYVKEGKELIKEDGFLRKRIEMPLLEDSFLVKLREECASASKKCESAQLFDWANKKCRLDVKPVIRPFIEQFIGHDCFRMLKDTEEMVRFYRDKKIDYVFARGNTDLGSMGALIAAKYCKEAKSVCIQHACLTRDLEAVGVMDTETYDFTFVSDDIAEDYYTNFIKERYKSDCQILQSPHHLKNIEGSFSKKKKNSSNHVLYVTQKFSDRVRCFNNLSYPITWYFELQKRLMDFFGGNENLSFIYKHVSSQDWAERSTLEYVRKKNYGNISVFSGDLLKSFDFADRVILDAPTSTAIFEASAAGKSFLVIYPEHVKILDKAKEVFGKTFQSFSSSDEAVRKVQEFLDADPEEYRIGPSLSETGFVDAFRKVNIEG